MYKGKMDCIDNISEDKEKEQNKNIINDKKDENRKNKIPSLLKTLGELFVEFFWFVHEIMKLALRENENNDERKIVCLSLSNKNYNLIEDNKDNKNNKDDKEAETILRLDFFDNVVCELNKTNINKLKIETTRALYFLLSESKEIFAFAQHI